MSDAGTSIKVDHVFASDNAYLVQVQVVDEDGDQTSTAAIAGLVIQSAQLQGGTLVVGGNTVILEPADANGGISVTVDGVAQGDFTPTSQIVIYGLDGGDHIRLQDARIGRHRVEIGLAAVIFGGAGGDTIDARGSSGDNVLVGGAGNDVLTGGSGRNLLIGGGGADALYGDHSQDILIGGTTDYDSNLAALNQIMAEWGRTNLSYEERIAQLDGSKLGGLNGSLCLNVRTVHDDGTSDTLVGGPGRDWYFASAEDVLISRKHNETVTSI